MPGMRGHGFIVQNNTINRSLLVLERGELHPAGAGPRLGALPAWAALAALLQLLSSVCVPLTPFSRPA